MVRAHVAALGGNAVVSYSMKECVFMENPNKNQVCVCVWERELVSMHMFTHKLCVCVAGSVPYQREWRRCDFHPRVWTRGHAPTATNVLRWRGDVNTHTHTRTYTRFIYCNKPRSEFQRKCEPNTCWDLQPIRSVNTDEPKINSSFYPWRNKVENFRPSVGHFVHIPIALRKPRQL